MKFNPFRNQEDTDALNELATGDLAVEIGTREGYSASIIAKNVKTLYVVDHWETLDVFRTFKDNMNEMKLNVHPLVMKSVDAARIFKDGILDFVFIDGDHTYEGVKSDIEAWLPKLKVGGVMAGHDYKEGAKGLRRAVDEKFDNVTVKSWIWYKRMNGASSG